MLEVDGIDVYYGDVQVLYHVGLNVNEGEVVAVVGANGAGKSTLLKTISGVLKPKRGSITFRGERSSEMSSDRIVAKGKHLRRRAKDLVVSTRPAAPSANELELPLVMRPSGP